MSAAVEAYRTGTVTIADLATRYGVAYASMRGLLHRRGVIDRDDHSTRILRVRRRHGEAVIAALPAGMAGEVDDDASGPRHVALMINSGRVAVELVDAGWDDRLQGMRLWRRVEALTAGRGLLVVWLDRDHRPDPARIAQHAVDFGPEGREYRVIWGDGEVIVAGQADDLYLPLTPPAFRGVHL